MKKYRDTTRFAPACRLIGLVGTRWALRVLLTLDEQGRMRFGALRRAVPGGISERQLAATLDELEAAGLVARKVFAEVPPRVEYALSPERVSLIPILRELIAWAEEHTRETAGE